MSSQQASATSLLGDCSRVLIESPPVKLALEPRAPSFIHRQCRFPASDGVMCVEIAAGRPHAATQFDRSHYRQSASVQVRLAQLPYHEPERVLGSHRCRLSTPVDNCVETQFRWHIRTLRGPPTDPGLGRSDARTTTLSDDVAARVRNDARIHASNTARDQCSTTEGPT